MLCGIVLCLLLSACTISNPFAAPTQSGAETPLPTASSGVSALASPTFTPRTITTKISGNCPANIASFQWDNLLGMNAALTKVQLIDCGSLEGAGSLEAVVGVGYVTPDAKLDVYVVDNLSTKSTITFKVPGLIDGDARISPTGTLMTAELGPNSIVSHTQNLFKEYQWNGSGFIQVLFPFIYPDMTHYQAEQDNTLYATEVAANQKADAWKTSGTAESGHLALVIFRWTSVTQTVTKYDKGTDTITVQTNNTGPGGGGFITTLHHLDGNANNILEIASVTPLDTNINIANPAAGALLTSPISVNGIAQGGSKLLGEIVVFDDAYVMVGDSGAIPSTGTGYANFTNLVRYTLNAHGEQEGVVVLMTTNQNNLALTNEIEMVKVFLSA